MTPVRSAPAFHAHPPARPCTAQPEGPLRGRVRVPGDKSISHRVFLFGLLAVGETRAAGVLEGDDVLRTAQACRALGGHIERRGPGEWSIRGAGLGSLLAPRDTLDFGNAGTGTRLMMGVVGGHAIAARFDGDASLRKRPMRRILDPLELMGARVREQADGGRCPILLQGTADPVPIEYRTPVASAQIKSAILLAGLNSPGRTTVIEAQASRDHTERMLVAFGAQVRCDDLPDGARRIALQGRPTLSPASIAVPGDPSSAAFPMVAALVTPGSDIVIEGVMMNPLRTGLVATLRAMGASIEMLDVRQGGGEEVADLRVRASELRGIDVPAARAPTMIDEYPVLAIAAAFAHGETRMRGLHELRVKESDRLAAVAAGLQANGVDCAIEGDDLVVRGGAGHVAGGGLVATQLDHRIAMSFLVMGFGARHGVQVDDDSMIATSYPTFAAQMTALGASLG